MRGGLCGNEEFERASTEARLGSEGSRWLEIIVHGKLGKNNAGRLAAAKQRSGALMHENRLSRELTRPTFFAGKLMMPSESLRPV